MRRILRGDPVMLYKSIYPRLNPLLPLRSRIVHVLDDMILHLTNEVGARGLHLGNVQGVGKPVIALHGIRSCLIPEPKKVLEEGFLPGLDPGKRSNQFLQLLSIASTDRIIDLRGNFEDVKEIVLVSGQKGPVVLDTVVTIPVTYP
jgi:hypothetical protein